MRRIAIINQKGGVGKTTTAVNLGAALARLGRRVLVIDMDPQANASTNLGVDLAPGEASTYTVLLGAHTVGDAVRATRTPGLSLLPSHLDLSGAELELAGAIGRETILRDALDDWVRQRAADDGVPPVDYILLDNPPSLGLLSINGLAASDEVLIAVQTEFFALQGLSKLVEVVQLLRRKLNPKLEITGVLACLYDSRLRLAREVLAELRAHFPVQCFRQPIGKSVKLAECPSFAQTIFEYAPESPGAKDHLRVAAEVVAREALDPELAARALPAPDIDEVERALAAAAVATAPLARPVVARVTLHGGEGPAPEVAMGPVGLAVNPVEAAVSAVEPTVSAVEPIVSAVEPAASAVEPAASAVEPAASAVEPAASTVEPAASTVEPAMSEVTVAAPPVELSVEPLVVLVPRAPHALPVLTQREYLGEERVALPSRRGPRRA
jgi:chromosome partitioning protein